MKTYTKDEIEKRVAFIWDGENPHIEVSVWDDCVGIELEQMYGHPTLNLKKLRALSEFFETDNINDDDRFSSRGCETCDYGSSYGFTLTIRKDED